MRVGFGIDVHAFGPGDTVVLGGVRIPHSRGVVAHSDGDVLLHALVDALLGAAALGDIGEHFPDSDPRWRDAASQQFVSTALEMLTRRSYRVVNVDLTLLAQQPRLAPWREQIRHAIATLLAIPVADVNVKATTTEHLGFLGRNEGLAAMATVLIDQI
jgi:2-C-methyl-D-erythritol 2,4-cyclodiphosphate synthase